MVVATFTFFLLIHSHFLQMFAQVYSEVGISAMHKSTTLVSDANLADFSSILNSKGIKVGPPMIRVCYDLLSLSLPCELNNLSVESQMLK